MLRMLNITIEYCQTREAFGKKIIDNQVIHYRLAELLTEIEALRSLLYRVVGKIKKNIYIFVSSFFFKSLCFHKRN